MTTSIMILGRNSRVVRSILKEAPAQTANWRLVGHADLTQIEHISCDTLVVFSYAETSQYRKLAEAIQEKVQYGRLIFISSLAACIVDRMRWYPYSYPRNKVFAESIFCSLPRVTVIRLPMISNRASRDGISSLAPSALAKLIQWIHSQDPPASEIAAKLGVAIERKGTRPSFTSWLILRTGGLAAYCLLPVDVVQKVLRLNPYGYAKLSNDLLLKGEATLVVG